MAFLLSALPAIGSGLLSAIKGGAEALSKGEGLGGVLKGAVSEGIKGATGLDVKGLANTVTNFLDPKDNKIKSVRIRRLMQDVLTGKEVSPEDSDSIVQYLKRVPIPQKPYNVPMFKPMPFSPKPYINMIPQQYQDLVPRQFMDLEENNDEGED